MTFAPNWKSIAKSGDGTVDHLIEGICAATAAAGSSTKLECRAVAIRHPPKGFVNFAVVGRITSCASDQAVESRITFGSMELLSWSVDLADITDTGSLHEALRRWRQIVGVAITGSLDTGAIIQRYGSANLWSPRPCWVWDLQERLDDNMTPSCPVGPYFNDEHDMFGESVADLAVDWLQDMSLRDETISKNYYRVVVEDRRAWIAGFDAIDNDLTVQVAGDGKLQLRCAAKRTGFRGEVQNVTAPVENDSAVLRFGGAVNQLSLWLLTAEGEWLDRYVESEAYTSWGPSIYNRPRRLDDEPYQSLQNALERGETDIVEFKTWIKTISRDSKTVEVLKTASAFANTKGGHLFIGVDDDAAIVGTASELKKAYGAQAKGIMEQMQDMYARDLQRLLNEGIRPTIPAAFDWIDHAGLFVLRVHVPQGQEGTYSIIESGETYVRRGATSRKALSQELVLRVPGGHRTTPNDR